MAELLAHAKALLKKIEKTPSAVIAQVHPAQFELALHRLGLYVDELERLARSAAVGERRRSRKISNEPTPEPAPDAEIADEPAGAVEALDELVDPRRVNTRCPARSPSPGWPPACRSGGDRRTVDDDRVDVIDWVNGTALGSGDNTFTLPSG